MAGKLPVRRRRQEPEDNGFNWTGALTGGLAGAGSGYLMSQLMGAEQEDPSQEGVLGDWGAAQCQMSGGHWTGEQCINLSTGQPIYPQTLDLGSLVQRRRQEGP